MLKNAFGEHYLQDSFAGGHLIDKTKVMQEFVKWANVDNKNLGTTGAAKAQWAMASTVANQDLKSNPQALDDMMHRGNAKSVEAATAKVGLQAKPEIVFMMWWRRAAFKKTSMKHLTPEAASKHSQYPVTSSEARKLMDKLVEQNFATKTTKGWFKNKKEVWSLNQNMIDVLKRDKKGKSKGAYNATLAYSRLDAGLNADHNKEAHEFNLAAYNMFLSNAYVGSATKYFHDKYCKEGVHVVTGEGADIGTIYGDANMLNAGAQKGVEYSAVTSQRSRESVFNIIDTGQDPTGDHTTSEIKKRFPTQVKPGPNDPPLTLENWNATKLFTEYDRGLLNPASSNSARLVYKVKSGGGISGGNAIDVEKIVHDAGPF